MFYTNTKQFWEPKEVIFPSSFKEILLTKKGEKNHSKRVTTYLDPQKMREKEITDMGKNLQIHKLFLANYS